MEQAKKKRGAQEHGEGSLANQNFLKKTKRTEKVVCSVYFYEDGTMTINETGLVFTDPTNIEWMNKILEKFYFGTDEEPIIPIRREHAAQR
jgi:endoglucanase Acf2